MAEYDYDFFVIGGGSGGVRAARLVAGMGKKVGIAEEYRYGGTCVIRGCVPKKLFVYASHISEEIEDAAGYGWTIGESKFDWPTLMDREIGRLEGLYKMGLGNAGAEIFETRAAGSPSAVATTDNRSIAIYWMVGPKTLQLRVIRMAAIHGSRTTWVEMAAPRGRQRRRNLTRDRRQLDQRVGIHQELRHALQQPLRVGMPGIGVDCLRGAGLDDAAQIHDRHAVRDVAHHGQIVRDEDQGDGRLALELQEQIDGLRLDRHVERGDRLVTDQHIRLHGQRAGNGNALALVAGELVRETVGQTRIEARPFKIAGHIGLFAGPVGQAMGERSFGDNVTHPHTGSLAKYGLDHDTMLSDFSHLVYCSISGYDLMAQGYGGIMSLTGAPDGEPMGVGVGIADVMCGMYAAVGILAALRDRAGEGQHIDLALVDSQVAWLINEGVNYLTTGAVPERRGNGHPNIAPYQVFETADGHVIVAVGNDTQFERFADWLAGSAGTGR